MWICKARCETDDVIAHIPEELDPDGIGILVNRLSGEVSNRWGDGTVGLGFEGDERTQFAAVDDTPQCPECHEACEWIEGNVVVLVGFYHEYGYNIWTLDSANGNLLEQEYEAGNNPAESVGTVPIERGEDLVTLQKFCNQTGLEMAKEMGLRWTGCSREDNPYEID